MSCRSESLRMYEISIRTQSSNDTLDRPCNCHIHVMPGVTSTRLRCHVRQFAVSSHGNGRGPTNDISPLSTFQSCGNSSTLVRRRILPTQVTRGSSRILKAGPSCSFCSSSSRFFFSASTHIDQNLYMRKGIPPLPLRH